MRACRDIQKGMYKRKGNLAHALEFGKEWDGRDITYVSLANQLEEAERRKRDMEDLKKMGK